MATTSKVLCDRMTAEQRTESEAVTAALLAEMPFDALRHESNVSQNDVAEVLGIKQASVSQQLCRRGRHVSTLRRYIPAVGGEFEVVAKFPDLGVCLTAIGDNDASPAT